MMPMTESMSHLIPNHILRVGQTSPSPSQLLAPSNDCSDADLELDASLENLNQLILELDPTFEPIAINKRHPSTSLHTDDSSPDEDVSSCILVPRGCSPGHHSSSISPSPSRSIPIPLYTGSSCSPQGSLVFSSSPSSSSSSRPPLPCGSVPRRRPPSDLVWSGSSGVGSLRLSQHSHRSSATSQLSTSPGSDTSYIMGSCQSLMSDDCDSSPESVLLYRTSGSFSEVSRSTKPSFSSRHSPEKPSPTGPSPLDHHPGPLHLHHHHLHHHLHSPGVHSSPASLAGSLAGSLTDIPVVLVNGAPHPDTEMDLSPESSPEALVQDMLQQRPSSKPASPHSFHGSQTSMKFVMDTSQLWFRPHINRLEAEALLRDQAAGSFVVRDSTSYRGSFGLAMKVEQVPANISPAGQPAEGSSDLIRHFLIESSAKGVRIKGSAQEPYFGSLSALVYQHTMTAYALPCKLLLQSHEEGAQHRTASEDVTKTASNFLYLSAVPTEMLTGPCAVQKAVTAIFQKDPSTISPSIVNLKVTPRGVTLTDVQRKLFFRRHYPAHLLSYSGEDPDKRLWNKGLKPARIFGIVAKSTEAGMENVCHVFAEYDTLQPCDQAVQLTQNIVSKP